MRSECFYTYFGGTITMVAPNPPVFHSLCLYDVTPRDVATISYSREKSHLEGNGLLLRTRVRLTDEFVLRHCSPLESHFIGDDPIPMDPRDLFVPTRYVLFPPIWSERKRKKEADSFILFPSSEKQRSYVLRSNLRTTVVFWIVPFSVSIS